MPCRFLIDSGAQVNTFTEEMFKALMSNEAYSREVFNVKQESDRSLKGYASNDTIRVAATFEAHLFISDDRPTLLEKFYVVQECQALLGRFTAARYSVLMLGIKVPLNTASFSESPWLHGEIAVIDLNEKFPKFNIPPVRIEYNRSEPPCRNVFMNIPQAVKPLVEERLQKLEMSDIIERVTDEMDSSFCSSMLIVPKGKNDIRLVIDLRGPNRYVYRTPFAMPTLEGILAELHGAKWFSTIDLSNAFFHIELDRESRHLTNFCTEFGMFRFVRLPFGLCNAPDIFQETMQRKILGGCKGVKNFQDDVLVFGSTKEEHDENLAAVLDRLRNHNVKLNESKCVFGSQIVTFLGFTLTPDGWKIEEGKLSAIGNCRQPETCSEVKSFLGLITFVDRFIPNRADLTQHLRALANGDKFYWTDKEEHEFQFLKSGALKAIKTLGYYSQTDPIELYVDASPVGLGAVLIQYDKDQSARVISCASKSLTSTEKRYPQSHKEALAVVWGIERFSTYLLSRSFVVRTDAEANQFIFNGTHRLGKRALSRADAWALRLQSFDFTIARIPGNMNVADALSRLTDQAQDPIPVEEDDESNFLYALDVGHMNITWGEIERRTEEDLELREVRTALLSNVWPRDLQKYEAQRKSLRFLGYLLFKDDRAVLPEVLRNTALQSAHGGHVGVVAMKKILRQFFWWPGMSTAAEKFVKDCEVCVQLSRKNPPIPLSSRVLPEGPWEILQIDFLKVPGFGTGEFLVVIDTYSRYLNVVEMKQTDADRTNTALSRIFLQWGLPLIIQSDNGPPFQSANFTKYWEDKGVKIRKAIPLCPQTNGAVERQNPGITKALTASKLEGSNWRHALERYVHNRNTLIPHSRLGITPFELMVGWRYRGTFTSLWNPSETGLDRLDVRERDDDSKLRSKKDADESRKARESDIKVGDTVLLAQHKHSKTDANFTNERFQIIARDGAKVVLMSANGIQYSRSVNDVKKAPMLFSSPKCRSSASTEDVGTQDGEGMLELPETGVFDKASNDGDVGSRENFHSGGRALRRRNEIQRPTRFDDNFIYTIFC
ncbi:uncharacterized protein K02A2.6-like isoform X1 [Aedes albopictus]|uniref:RNA-directed DNA polymerase n=1 Tax=Aedes albopictus TaxID=7160 RepID=A0ABM1YAK2_AEDAL